MRDDTKPYFIGGAVLAIISGVCLYFVFFVGVSDAVAGAINGITSGIVASSIILFVMFAARVFKERRFRRMFLASGSEFINQPSFEKCLEKGDDIHAFIQYKSVLQYCIDLIRGSDMSEAEMGSWQRRVLYEIGRVEHILLRGQCVEDCTKFPFFEFMDTDSDVKP